MMKIIEIAALELTNDHLNDCHLVFKMSENSESAEKSSAKRRWRWKSANSHNLEDGTQTYMVENRL